MGGYLRQLVGVREHTVQSSCETLAPRRVYDVTVRGRRSSIRTFLIRPRSFPSSCKRIVFENGLHVSFYLLLHLLLHLLLRPCILPEPSIFVCFVVSQGKPTLVIGNHKLEGKVVPEGKPLLVLRKVVVESGEDGNGTGADVSDQPSRAAGQPRVEYSIVGKVNSKMIFKTRPKPLIRKLGTSALGPRK